MAGTSSKKEKRKERKIQKQAAKSSTSEDLSEDFYSNMNDGLQRNLMHYCTVPVWIDRFKSLPSVRGKTLAWVQLLLVDEQKTAQLKLYALGSRGALADDDSGVAERSRKLLKDAAPSFMNDIGLWIFSRSLVRKGYNGSLDFAALAFSAYDPLESLDQFPMDPSCGIRCAEILMLFAIDGDVQADLYSHETLLEFFNSLNGEDGIRKIQAFAVTAASVVATREKLQELRGSHLTGGFLGF